METKESKMKMRALRPFRIPVSSISLLLLLAVFLYIITSHRQGLRCFGQTMGTHYDVQYGLPYTLKRQGHNAHTIEQGILAILEKINAQMSLYRPDSEISRFNRSRQTGEAFPISVEFATVVDEAMRVHQLAYGALDITLAGVSRLWGFGSQAAEQIPPSKEALREALFKSGMDKLLLEENALIKTVPELMIDLSSIAKGYAVDLIGEWMEGIGIEDYLVDIGGECRAKGNNRYKKNWRIVVESSPLLGFAPNESSIIISPGHGSVATSGEYRNFYFFDNKRYSHTLNPRTGYPVTHNLFSVTVIHPSCMTADAFATAFNVLGISKGLRLAEAQQIPVLFLVTDATTNYTKASYSSAFLRYIRNRAFPGNAKARLP